MFVCGINVCGGYDACAFTPTAIDQIEYIKISNGMYDSLYASKNTDFEISNEPPQDWDFDTVLYAKFSSNTNAGNVDWNLSTVSDIAIKSRKQGEFKWKTVSTKKINVLEDFTINFSDYLVPSGQTTEYAIVPVLNGSEGTYAITSIKPDFDRMFLIEGDTVYSTIMTDGFCDTTRNIPSSNVELLNSKYPIFVRNTIANYDTGTCTGYWVPSNPDNNCEFALDKEYDFYRINYQREVMDFICDGNPKVLKVPDGRMWIIQVTPSPTDSADQTYQNRQISFQWVEVGDYKSEEDCYYLGISPVSEEWWNR